MQSSDMQSGSERRETQSSAEAFAGVPLMQLAAITAARAEGFPLEEILNAEGLAPAAYRAADVAYKRRLVDPGQRDRLCADYQKELAQAEDRLTRKVSPIDEDVDSWVRFLGTYGGQSAPADWLVAMGLTLPDLSRLSRAWKRRLDADDALCKRAEKSARDKKPYDVSSLRVSPAKLIPSPLAKPIGKQALEDTGPFPTQSSSPVKRWIPRADPMVESAAPPVVHQNLGIAFDFPIKPAAASPLVMTSPAFSLPIEEVLPFAPGPDIPEEAPTPEEEAAALAPPREALSGTSLALDIPRGPATPFAASISSAGGQEKPKPIELPKVKPAPAELGGTSLAVDIPRGPATPFVEAKESPAIAAKPVETKLPEVKAAPAKLGGTSLAVDIPRGPATPFVPIIDAPVIAAKPVEEKLPEVKQVPAKLGGTSLAVDIPRGPATPFVPIIDPPVIAAKPIETKLPEVKPAPAKLGGTSLAVDIPRGPAMPFAAAKEAAAIEENVNVPEKPIVNRAPEELSGTSFSLDIPRGPATPFVAAKDALSRESAAKSSMSSTQVLELPLPEKAATPLPKEDKPQPKPLLSLEQHAALTVEIATYPKHAMAILGRYGLTPPQKVDLDQHYRRIVAAEPAKQAAWHAAYGAHYATLMRRR